jgi:hypothetical protein
MTATVFNDEHVHLDSKATLLAVYDELTGDECAKFRATLMSHREDNPPGPARHALEVWDNYGNKTIATVGDHLVLTYGRLLKLSDAEYTELVGA